METGDCEMGAMHDGYRDDRACAPHPHHGWVSTRRTDTGPYIRPGQDHCLRGHDDVRRAPAPRADAGGGEGVDGKAGRRSEEHTSALQSLMRISYAVFCLKKKTNKIDRLETKTCM